MNNLLLLFIFIFILCICIYINNKIGKKIEKFDSEVLPANWLYNANLDPNSNPTLTHINTFRDIPYRFITWTPYTTPIEREPEFNPYLYNNNLMYPLY